MRNKPCFVCGQNVPLSYCVQWCDDCMDELAESGYKSIEDWLRNEVGLDAVVGRQP